jgi:hypothetical protein
VIFRGYIFTMPSPEQIIELLAPAAAAILAADADAVAAIKSRKDELIILDSQPAAAAMANERRARVATRMRTEIAPRHDWTLRDEHLSYGAYEWELPHGVVLRLSKTTPASRQEAALSSMGIDVQASLFPLPRTVDDADDVILLRLNGNALYSTTVDVANVDARGEVEFRLLLKTIAKSAAAQMPAPAKPQTKVELPADQRQQRSNHEA